MQPQRRAFGIPFKDLDLWSVTSFRKLVWNWSPDVIKPLNAALERRQEEVNKRETSFEAAPPVTLRFDGSMEKRELGSKTSFKGKLFLAHAGDVIYSKIDVRNGAIGIVPDFLSQISVTSEFPVYSVRKKVAAPEYIQLLFKTENFRERINGMISGASGRKRVQPEQLESLDIPLPPLETQHAIVRYYQQGQEEVRRLEEEAKNVEVTVDEILYKAAGITVATEIKRSKAFTVAWKDLSRWSFDAVWSNLKGLDKPPTSTYPYLPLGEIATVSYGVQKSPSNRPGVHARPYLRVANVRKGHLDLSEIKYINVPDTEFEFYKVVAGDILFVEGNGSRAELGRVAIWNGEIENCVHQNHLIKVRPNKTLLCSKYAMFWFNSTIGRNHFFRNAKTSSGLGTINSNEVRLAPIPLPPLEVQRNIVEQVQTARNEATKSRDVAKTLREQIKLEVEAMILGTKPVGIV
jgi:type I restriction enzyme, S subunit